jgi:phage tail sheath gpL-like
MTVAFNRMPTNLRVPFFYAEVNSGLSYFAGNSKHLIIGQMLAAGTASPNVPTIVQVSNIEALYGSGSMLCEMIYTAKINNAIGEVWALPLSDPAGTAATGTIALAGTPTTGILTAYIAGQQFTVTVSATDTPTTLAAALVVAINKGYTDLNGRIRFVPVTAGAVAGTITLTAKHVGLLGNNIQVDKDLIGNEGPNAALVTITAMAGGAGTPLLTSALAGCGMTEFDMISFPYADATSLNSMQSFLADSGGRWDPTVDLYGHAFTANFGNLSAQTTLGLARNDPHLSIMGVQASPTPPWIWAAAIGAQVQLHKNLGADLTQAGEISRPMQTIILLGVKPPKTISQYWQMSDRQTLYFDGISGFFVTRDGQVALDRVISTYQTNVWGSPDTTWLDIETLYQTMYALRFLRQVVTQTYPRSALVPDNPGALQGFTTPTDIKATVVHAYGNLVLAGVMKNKQLFADSLVVEQAADPNRVNAYLPFDVVNQLRIFAANATTFLNAAAN